MKVILISTAGVPRGLADFLPDNGLALLSSCLLKENVDVKIFDFNLPSVFDEIYSKDIKKFLERFSNKIFIEEKKPSITDILKLKFVLSIIEKRKKEYIEKLKNFIFEIVEKEKTEFVGFKLWAGDGFEWSIEIGKYLKKKKPEIKIFGGGPQVDIFEHLIFERGSFFDALCYGEGEEAITGLYKFVQGKNKLKDIPNIIFKENGKIIKTERKYVENLDELPLPVYTPDVYWKIEEKIKMFVIDESRGCNNACFFCIHPKKSGKRKEKSVEKLIEEIRFYINNYRVYLYRFAGSSTPGDLILEFANRIIKEGIKIDYVTSGYVEDFDIDFKILKKSGCQSIFFGVESANEEILKKGMNKNVKKEYMEKVLKKCKEAGIFTVASLIYPAPFETEETRSETIEFLKEVNPDSCLIQFPGIYPGTMWFKYPERFNFELADKETYPLKVMNYKIKALFPPRFWQPLPYKVNGMDFKKFAYETERFQKDVLNFGINTSISNEDFLFYKYSGFKTTEDFLKFNRVYFYSGNSEKLKEEIENINKNSGR
ncbi:MAG: B12-binding domain-containing radical SAM protein [Candidatus Ratteibacteria bacterium]